MNSHRVQWLDFDKGIAILFVVLAHSSDFINGLFDLKYVLFTFVMPIFFSISGYLYKPTKSLSDYLLMLYKKIISIGIPYVIFTSIYLLICLFTHPFTLNNIFYYSYSAYIMPIGHIGYLWFLYSLILIFIISGIFDLFKLPFIIQVSLAFIFMICQMGDYLLDWQVIPNNINSYAGVLGYLFFFYIGRIVCIYIKNIYHCLNTIEFLSITGIIWIFILIIQMRVTGINYNTNLVTYDDVLSKLLSIFVFYSLAINFRNNKIFRYFTKYGKYTLIIYMIHIPFLVMFNLVLRNIIFNKLTLLCILFILGWSFSTLTCYFANNLKILNFIFYPRKHVNKFILKTKFGYKLLK